MSRNALVYCEGAFRTTYGKTAHGLVRRSRRYQIVGVIDSTCAGEDAGMLLDGRSAAIPVYPDLRAALDDNRARRLETSHLVIGLAPDGGRLPGHARRAITAAIASGMHIVNGLHDYVSEDEEIVRLAEVHGVELYDVRKPPPVDVLHHFSGEIEEVSCLKVAVLGTDSALGKRTTAWLLVDALEARGKRAQLVGTGQTAWLQGSTYGVVLDSLVNDFVAGEIEHAVVRCYRETDPEVIVLEGQGSLMNPAYPGGFELLAAGRPDVIVLQHAPGRKDYDGFPGYPIQPIEEQIAALELIGGRPVVAMALNHEAIPADEIDEACRLLGERTGLFVCDPLRHGVEGLIDVLLEQPSLGGTKSQ